jgi:hypothetical protein
MAMQQLTAIGWGLVTFGIIIGVGVTILTKFGDNVVTCGTIGGGAGTWNTSLQLCQNVSGTTAAGSGAGYNVLSYVTTQMGSTGLAGWIPVIIVIVIAGLIFLYLGKGVGKNY